MEESPIIICRSNEAFSKSEIAKILDACAQDFPHSIGSTLLNREDIVEKLYSNAHWILSYDAKNSLIGFIAYYVNPIHKFFYIPYAWVNQKSRRIHCGTNMMQELKRQMQSNIQEIRLEVRKDNSAAIDFYQRNGFVVSENRLDKFLLVYKN